MLTEATWVENDTVVENHSKSIIFQQTTLTSMLVLIMDQLYNTLVVCIYGYVEVVKFCNRYFWRKNSNETFLAFLNTVNGRDDEQAKASRLRISHYSKEPVAEYH